MMKCHIVALGAVVLLVTGCSATHQDEYVWVKDYEQMRLIEQANRSSAQLNQMHWVNPPMKRIHRSELAKVRQQEQ
ncbi:MAG: hypothetical protein LAT66_05620 [Alkalimonas sp.]|nr:hypothetical protein [Alkalimonas sp.]